MVCTETGSWESKGTVPIKRRLGWGSLDEPRFKCVNLKPLRSGRVKRDTKSDEGDCKDCVW